MSSDPEVNKPGYDLALEDFFQLLNRHTASVAVVEQTLRGLFTHSLQTASEHADKLLVGYSHRFAFDEDAFADFAQGSENEDEEEPLYEYFDDLLVHNKAQLLASVTGLLVASEFSTLSSRQRTSLMARAMAFGHDLGKGAALTLHNELSDSLIKYLAHDVELAGIDGCDDRTQRSNRGRFVLNIATDYRLFEPSDRRMYNKALDRA